MASILLLGCCIFLVLVSHVLAIAVEIETSEEFRGALRNQTISTIILRQDIRVAPEDWQQYSKLDPLVLRRNVTITSNPPGLLLDFDYIQLKVRIAKGLSLTFRDLIISQVRYGSGMQYMDFLAFSPGAVVVLINTVMDRVACVPNEYALSQLPEAPSYPGYPGQQNASDLTDFQYCIGKNCFPEAIVYWNTSFQPPSSEDQDAGGYGVVLLNTSKACNRVVDKDCLQQELAEQCVRDIIDSTALVDTPGKLQLQREKQQQAHMVAVIVGPLVAGLGTVLCLLLLLGAIVWRRRHPTPEQGLPVHGPMGSDKAAWHTPDELQAAALAKLQADQATSSSWDIAVQQTGGQMPSEFSGNHSSNSRNESGANVVQLGVLLGAGSFGRVYKGRWRSKDVAVKVIEHSSGTSEVVLNEVNLMLSFNHPNIVRALHVINWVRRRGRSVARSRILGSGDETSVDQVASTVGGSGTPTLEQRVQEDSQTWIVQEHCDAGNLGDAFADRPRPIAGLDHLRLLCRLLEVAQAMSHLHARHVVHGDLKTANVLLSTCESAPFGRIAKVTDFGISKALQVGQTHRSTRTLGTVSHMSPELLRMGRLSAAADVYAFGIMMWELITSSVAFGNMHYGEVVQRVGLQGERLPIPEQAPEEYALLMGSCWSEDPSTRPTFEQVVDCLSIMVASLQQQLATEGCSGVTSNPEGLPDSAHGPQDLW